MKVMNENGFCKDSFQKISLNKRGQFFILSAVIIASIIVSMTALHNNVQMADTPKKFYYYSQQLNDEIGSVVNYALYSDPSGTNIAVRANLNDFLQQGIEKTLQAYPGMELFSCFSDPVDSDELICQNNGTKTVFVNSTNTELAIDRSSIKRLNINNDEGITVRIDGSSQIYNIPLGNSMTQRGQFYFIASLNATSGQYISQSNDLKAMS
jgi:hypothetical protein